MSDYTDRAPDGSYLREDDVCATCDALAADLAEKEIGLRDYVEAFMQKRDEAAQLRAERETLREALRRLHDAVWEYDGPASAEMDAAAGEALAVLGDVILLAPVPEEVTTAENADLRRRLECEHAVALELIAERDRAVEELGRLQQLSLTEGQR